MADTKQEHGKNYHEFTHILGEYTITTKKSQNVAFEDALEETGSGKFTIFLAVICGLCLYTVNIEFCQVGFILPVAQCELQLDSFKKGLLASSNAAGVITASLFWGYLTDMKGRKAFLIYNLAAAFLVGVLSAFVISFWWLLVMRFINGVCISAPASVAFVYLEEFQNSKNRAKSVAIVGGLISAAITALPLYGWPILQNSISINLLGLYNLTNWRIYMLVNTIPYLVTCLALIWFPESPKFLYSKGRTEESLRILKKMHAINTGEPAKFSVESLDEKVTLQKELQTDKHGFLQLWSNQILPLFKPPYLLYTIACCVMQSGFFIMSTGLYAWYPDILNQISLNKDKSLKVCSALTLSYNRTVLPDDELTCNETVDSQIFILNIIIGIAYTIAYASYGVVAKALGNRNFLAACMVISSISTFALLFITQKLLIDILFMVAIVLPGISVTILGSWTTEIFPTHVRGIVVCITMTIGRLSMVIASAVAGLMFEWNCSVTFSLYGLCLVACLMLSFVLPKKS